jgi:uracil-DNA glycosylase family 4
MSPLVIVGESPGKNEIREELPFVGPSGELLKAALAQHPDLNPYITNSHQCFPGTSKSKDADKLATAVGCCQPRLLAELRQHPHQIILALGAGALWSVTNNFGLKITQVRGQVFPSDIAARGIVAAVHPSYLMRGFGSLSQFMADVDYACQLAKGLRDYRQYIVPKFKVISSEEEILNLAKQWDDPDVVAAADTETGGFSGFDFLRDHILCSGFCVDPALVYIVPSELTRATRSLFDSRCRFVWHNGKFDAKFFIQAGVDNVRVDEDTMLMSYCLSPETRVLKTDLTWTRIAEVNIGDQLIGFDEYKKDAVDGNQGTSSRWANGKPPGGNFKPSKVLALKRLLAPRYKLSTEKGEVISSDRHMWAARIYGQRWARWITTEKLAQLVMSGKQAELFFFAAPWEVDDTRIGGYISGILDGEGTLNSGWTGENGDSNWDLSFAQNPGKVLDQTLEYLKLKGFDTNYYKYPYKSSAKVSFRGYKEGLRALGTFRPVRLLEKAERVWRGNRKCTPVKIVSAEFLGMGEVIGIETETRTLIAEGYKSHNCLDTTKGIHDLESVASDYLGAPDWKYMIKPYLDPSKYPKGYNITYADIPLPVLYDYTGRDISATKQVFPHIRNSVKSDPHSEKLYTKTLIPMSAYLTKIEMKGMELDVAQVQENDKTLQAEITKYTGEINKYSLEYGHTEINANSPAQLSTLLYDVMKLTIKGKRPTSTDVKTLEKLPATNPVVIALRKNRKVQKARSTYVVPALDHEDSKGKHVTGWINTDGGVHTTYKIHGTGTGRLASEDPNLLNIPRDPKLKGQFKARDGKLYLESDANQAELRILAELSGDETLSKIYTTKGMSVHDVTCDAIFGTIKDYTPEFLSKQELKFNVFSDPSRLRAEQKMRAKNVNFGIPYGISAFGLADQIDDTPEVAQVYLEGWYKRYPGARQFLLKIRESVTLGKTLVTSFGRKKRLGVVSFERLNDIQNEACNFFMQSIVSDIVMHVGMQMQPRVAKHNVDIVNTVYDSILYEVPNDQPLIEDIAAETTARISETAKVWGIRKIPIIGDAKLGKRWGNLTDLHKYDWSQAA